MSLALYVKLHITHKRATSQILENKHETAVQYEKITC